MLSLLHGKKSAPASGSDEDLLRLLRSNSSPAVNPSTAVPSATSGGAASGQKPAHVPSTVSAKQSQQAQKSRALLSLLKSTNAGPAFQVRPGAQQPMKSGAVASTGAAVAAAPAEQSTVNATGAAAVALSTGAAAVALSTPVKVAPTGDAVTTIAPATPATEVNATAAVTTAKKPSFFRSTRNQPGSLHIVVGGAMRSNVTLRPAMNMTVVWSLPAAELAPEADIVVGLVRYGSYTNSPCIVAKGIDKKAKPVMDSTGRRNMMQGHIPFHAPKAAGLFVYRMFDQSTKETALQTMATSAPFSVDLVDFDVNLNLRFIHETLTEDSKIKGLAQMPAVLKGIKNNGRIDNRDYGNRARPKPPAELLNECVRIVIDEIHASTSVLEKWQDLRKQMAAAVAEMKTADAGVVDIDVTGDLNAAAAAADGDSSSCSEAVSAISKELDDLRSSYKTAGRVHVEAYEVLDVLINSRIPWYLLSEQLKRVCHSTQALFCPLLQRYFNSFAGMQQARSDVYGFAPAINENFFSAKSGGVASERQMIMTRLQAVNEAIDQLLPSLFPSSDFMYKREQARLKLEQSLQITSNADVVMQLPQVQQQSSVIPAGAQLCMYGSSANNFGSDGADLDMCLTLPAGQQLSHAEKPVVIERLAEALTRLGMCDIRTRATARIPIVQFVDPLTCKFTSTSAATADAAAVAVVASCFYLQY